MFSAGETEIWANAMAEAQKIIKSVETKIRGSKGVRAGPLIAEVIEYVTFIDEDRLCAMETAQQARERKKRHDENGQRKSDS